MTLTAAHTAPPEALRGAEVPVLRLKRGEDRRIRAGHLWIYSNEVDNDSTPLTRFERGAVARVHSSRDQFIGYACVNPHALICARLLSRDVNQPIGVGLLVKKLRSALALRERLYAAPYYRAVYGDSDGLPGLVLDRYGDVLVGQIATCGMEALRPQVEQALHEVFAPSLLVWKNDSSARDLEGLPREVQVVGADMPEELEVIENGLHYSAPLAAGQKTGWFYDQAANRLRLNRLMGKGRDGNGARVLDVCSYVGAWGISALKNGAAEALCIDSSERALEFAARNATRNAVPLQLRKADAFDALAALHAEGRRFDVVVIDPPAFIKRKRDLPQGEAAYRKINQLAMRLLDGDGLLVSCSCSFHLGFDELPEIIQSAARHAECEVQILEAGGQSPDHPILPAIRETRYLKAFFCRVTR
jgi:23S rRNA (cytosine1962-C5)-methyltransferase